MGLVKHLLQKAVQSTTELMLVNHTSFSKPIPKSAYEKFVAFDTLTFLLLFQKLSKIQTMKSLMVSNTYFLLNTCGTRNKNLIEIILKITF